MVLQGLSDMHAFGRGHCDLKPENTVVHFDPDLEVDKLTLIDLGSSCIYEGRVASTIWRVQGNLALHADFSCFSMN